MTVQTERGENTRDSRPTGQRIIPHLWFDSQAEEAAEFYTSIFPNSRITGVSRYGKEGFEVHGQPEGTAMTADFELAGTKFIALNGGPNFKFTPAISFFVTCETAEEVDRICGRLLDGGTALMELDSYPWSERYAWVEDRFGVTWQVYKGELEQVHGQMVIPCLSFTGMQVKAEEAMNRYIEIFPNSRLDGISTMGEMGEEPAHAVAHAQFILDGEVLMAQDTTIPPEEGFNEAISLLINVQGQDEIDHYWNQLTKGGDPKAQQCGWLKDEYGLSWQVFPVELGQMMQDPDPGKVGRVTNAFLQMKKFDLGELRAAFEG